MSYDAWKLDYTDRGDYEPESDYCCVCDTYFSKDDGEFCHCHCSECGEELPESENGDAHCENCCECDACYDAEEKAQAIFESTGEWIKETVTGEKVFTIFAKITADGG